MGTIINESFITQDESLEKNNKEKEYLDYINNHILNVQIAFNRYFLPLLDKEYINSNIISTEELKIAIKKASILIRDHDLSKFGVNEDGLDEFAGYRLKYYPTSEEKADPEYEKKADEICELAWQSHYRHNPHHPAYWINDDGTIRDMDLEYIIEMICDWRSFSIKSGDPNEVITWYKEKAKHEKESMSDKTKQIVEELLFNIAV